MTPRIPAAKCRHCHRPITKPYGWLHTDGRVECLDPWRWDGIGSVAEPEPENPRLPKPTYRPSPNPTGRNGR